MDRTSFRLFACGLAVSVVSCTANTVAPDPVVSTSANDFQQFNSTSGAPTSGPDTLPLITCKNARSDSATASIGASGGSINFGPHRLIIPAGALTATTRISARTYSGDTLAVDLEPHGLQFNVPATLVINYKGCEVSDQYATGILYTDTTLTRVLSIVASQDHYKKWMVVGTINHFSVYAPAETRKPR